MRNKKKKKTNGSWARCKIEYVATLNYGQNIFQLKCFNFNSFKIIGTGSHVHGAHINVAFSLSLFSIFERCEFAMTVGKNDDNYYLLFIDMQIQSIAAILSKQYR